MAEKNRATLKTYFETGDRPTQQDFIDLIDSAVNRTDDPFVQALPDASTTAKGIVQQATTADVQAGTNTQLYVTPAGAKTAVQTFAPVASVNGQTGAVTLVIPPPVPDASTTVKGIVQQAATADVQAGTNTQLYVTPAGAKTAAQTFAPVTSVNGQTGAVTITGPIVPDASTTVKGIVLQATVTDAQAGTNTQLYVTPAGAKAAAQTFAPVTSVNGLTGAVTVTAPPVPDASTTVKGIVQQATVADAQAGTNTQLYVTPAGAKAAAQTFAPVTSVNGLAGVVVIPDASPTVKGTVQQASVADAQAGTNTQLYVTPATAKASVLANAPVKSVNGLTGVVVIPDASTTAKGIVQQAAPADITAGTNTLLYVTPAGAKTAAQTFAPVTSVNGLTGAVVLTIPVLQDTPWVNLTLLNAFTSFGAPNQTPRYRKKMGVVYVEGSIKAGTNGAVIANLPVGFRPAATLVFIVATSTTAHARITISATGDIVGTTINTTLTSLSGIVFLVD
jgi:flagellar biosynthesis/type III secretory pathway protein FliH